MSRRGVLVVLYSYLEGGCIEESVGLFSGDERQDASNGLKLCQGRVRLGIRWDFFMETVFKLWNRLPEGTVETPSVEVFKRCVDVALRDVVDLWC